MGKGTSLQGPDQNPAPIQCATPETLKAGLPPGFQTKQSLDTSEEDCVYFSVPANGCQSPTPSSVRGWSLMARFKKMAPAATTGSADPKKGVEQVRPDEAALAVALAAVKELPDPDPSLAERMSELRRLSIRTPNPDASRGAIEAAARLRLMMGSTDLETDRKITGIIARFLVWSAYGDVIDPIRAFTRANVNRYLASPNFRSERGNQHRRYVLYAAGRCLHPGQFPPRRTPVAPRKQATSAADPREVRYFRTIIPGLPAWLGRRVEVLLDLAYGAGARPADFRTLRGTAISSVVMHDKAFSVVALPNLGGGVRHVPVIDPDISARLLGLAARVGDGLVLAPNGNGRERNFANRVNCHLKRHGYPTITAGALRNLWLQEWAERIPITLLFHLADVTGYQFPADQLDRRPQYKTRHAITLMLGDRK